MYETKNEIQKKEIKDKLKLLNVLSVHAELKIKQIKLSGRVATQTLLKFQ